jgi:hypothetical protein
MPTTWGDVVDDSDLYGSPTQKAGPYAGAPIQSGPRGDYVYSGNTWIPVNPDGTQDMIRSYEPMTGFDQVMMQWFPTAAMAGMTGFAATGGAIGASGGASGGSAAPYGGFDAGAVAGADYGLGAGAAPFGGFDAGAVAGANYAPSMPAAVAEAPGSVASAQSAPTGSSAGSSSWKDYARLGNAMMQQGQGGGGGVQPMQHLFVGKSSRNPYLTPLTTLTGQERDAWMAQGLQQPKREQDDLFGQGGLYGGGLYGI